MTTSVTHRWRAPPLKKFKPYLVQSPKPFTLRTKACVEARRAVPIFRLRLSHCTPTFDPKQTYHFPVVPSPDPNTVSHVKSHMSKRPRIAMRLHNLPRPQSQDHRRRRLYSGGGRGGGGGGRTGGAVAVGDAVSAAALRGRGFCRGVGARCSELPVSVSGVESLAPCPTGTRAHRKDVELKKLDKSHHN